MIPVPFDGSVRTTIGHVSILVYEGEGLLTISSTLNVNGSATSTSSQFTSTLHVLVVLFDVFGPRRRILFKVSDQGGGFLPSYTRHRTQGFGTIVISGHGFHCLVAVMTVRFFFCSVRTFSLRVLFPASLF